MQDFILIISGLLLWILGANWLLKGSVRLSLRFNIPKIVVGMTVVSLITVVPELLIGLKAVAEDIPNLALGTVMGSNMVNLGLILAIALILSGIEVYKQFYTTNWSVMMLASTLFFGFIYFDGEIQRYEGFFMLVALFLLLTSVFWFQRNPVATESPWDDRKLSQYKTILFLGLGGLAVWGGSEALLKGAWKYIGSYGEGDRIIAVIVLPLVTGIPELAVAVIAIIKKQRAIILGNLIGSSMFNLLAVLGISARIRPIKVMDQVLLTNDILWMMGISFMLLPLMFFSMRSKLNWKGGSVLLAIYLAFLYFTLI